MVDLEAIDEQLWETYKDWCSANDLQPRPDSFQQWVEENFD